MAAVMTQTFHSFGLRTGVSNNLLYLDDQTVIYPCGNNCVRYNIDLKCQRFIPGTKRSKDMKALAISINKQYLAVSECLEKATITVYDLQHGENKKIKVLTAGDVPVNQFTYLAFSPDSKYLIGQTGEPDWTLFYWLWEKKKLISTVKATTDGHINQISFHPHDNTQICVIGNGVFKIFRLAGEVLKQSSTFKPTGQNFLCHTWVQEQVIAGTEMGQLMMFENGRLRWEINLQSLQELERMRMDPESLPTIITFPRVSAVVGFSNSFVCSAGPGLVYLFEKTETDDQFKKTKDIRIPPELFSNGSSSEELQEISTLCLSPSEDMLATSTGRGQLYCISLSIAQLQKENCAWFKLLSQPFHSSGITSLSTCVRKPLIATCSQDGSVRIWNFESNVLELSRQFDEEVYSVALHPSGLFVLVGFLNKLCLMTLMNNDIRAIMDFTLRACRECLFSNGGHLFAVANRNDIIIYATFTCKAVLRLKGHNEKVQTLVFIADDSRLVSCGMDGAVYEWNTLTGERVSESVQKSCSYNGVTVSVDSKTFFVVGTDSTLKEIHDCQIIKEMSLGEAYCTTITMSRSGRVIFIGTSSGTVRAIKHPLPTPAAWQEYQAHSAPVIKMMVTYDDQLLLSVSKDGCIFVWEIIDQDSEEPDKERMPYAKETLIYTSDLEEKKKVLLDLQTRLEELQEENKFQLSLKDNEQKKKINELTKKFYHDMGLVNAEKERIKAEKKKEKKAHKEAVAELLKKHEKELHDLESSSNQKLMYEYERYKELKEKLQNLQKEYEAVRQNLEESKAQALEEMEQSYEAQLEEKSTLLKQNQAESEQQIEELNEYITQVEEDVDLEVQEIKTQFGEKLQEKKFEIDKLEKKFDMTSKLYTGLSKQLQESRSETKTLKQEIQKLEAVIRALEKDVTMLKRGIKQRDGLIQKQVRDACDLEKKNDNLSKMVEVMKYREQSMKEQIEPNIKEIARLHDKLVEMEAYQKEYLQTIKQLELKNEDQSSILKAKDKELSKEGKKVQDIETLVQRFKSDLHMCVQNIQEPKQLKENVHQLYKTYVQQSDVEKRAAAIDSPMDQQVMDIQHDEKKFLENTILTLKKQISRDTNTFQVNLSTLRKENVALITEINNLRHEQHKATGRVGAAHLSIEEAEKIIKLQQEEIQKLRQEMEGPKSVSSSTRPTLVTTTN